MSIQTSIQTIGIVSPGDMGHAVGRRLAQHGLRVVTSLQNRSERTSALATEAGIADVGSMHALVTEADAILSILVPAHAADAAREVAAALAETGADLLYADCNAIAPATVRQIAESIEGAGGRFVDASIIGPPPREGASTRFYASGPHVGEFIALGDRGLDVRPLGDAVGQASAIKMCYAALTKGLTALGTELLTAASALGVADALREEFQSSQGALYERFQRGIPNMPAKSRRWVGEMEEIAATFASVGLTPNMLQGAADMYRFVGGTELADRNPEDPEPLPSLEEMIGQLAAYLK